jgi:hypothetical protein
VLVLSHARVIPSRFNAGAMAIPQFEVLYLSENHLGVVPLFEVQPLLGSPTQPGGTILRYVHAMECSLYHMSISL